MIYPDSVEVLATYTHKNRSEWGRGPWTGEPDKVHFVDKITGADCLAVRGPVGAWCGYVAVEPGHPSFEVGYNDVAVDVHGGLTFANSCQEDKEHGICHVPRQGKPDHVWWLGFDCAHGGDLCPGYPEDIKWLSEGTYRSLSYVLDECQSLAKQLEHIMKEKGSPRAQREGRTN